MQVDWKRIENVLRHNVYDESQHPRDAKGSDTGGQWTSTGGGKMSHLDKMKAVVYKIAEAEKFPKDRIEFDPDPSAVRLPNGKTFERLAYYSHEDKKIHFCPLIMKGKEDALAGVVAHEINHTKYDLGAVAQGIKKTIGNDEWDKKSWSYLKDKDGVTPYSKMIWDNADDNSRSVRETLAEVARLKALGKWDTVDPLWQNIYSNTADYLKTR